MRPSRSQVVAAMAMVLLFAGCGTGGSPMSTPTSPSDSARPPFQTTSPLPSSPTAGAEASVPPKRWAAILGDLAGRGVPTDAVQLVSARSVTWNNGALGCPKPGQMYTQALVNGMQVIVSVGDVQYDYRFGSTDTPKLCKQ